MNLRKYELNILKYLRDVLSRYLSKSMMIEQ
jgi:hypothetical protein